jgi:hypothetical protein
MFHSEIEFPSSPFGTALEKGIWFDPDRIVLEGTYGDQITAYRARKRWIRAFETNFLLEGKHDFEVHVDQAREVDGYVVRCDFLTACGRYAFWRLTHNQAPEVQFLLETAHLPSKVPSPEISLHALDLYDDFGPSGLRDRGLSCREPGVRATVKRCVEWLKGKISGHSST